MTMAQESTQAKNRKEESPSQLRGLERRPTSAGVLRRDPFWSPSEFFTASPFTLMRRFAEQMDRAFTGDWGFDFAWDSRGMFAPAIDVSERDGKLIVHADLPGLQKEDLKLEATEDSLIIQGERRQEHEEQERGYRRSERKYGTFYRSIPLPEGAQTEQARAEFKDGVLEVSVPIPASRKRGREVPIEGSPSERKQVGSESTGQIRDSKTG
jgi:HSP20 family protein